MPFPDAEYATVSQEKICDYLLNHDHPIGGAKAAWFEGLGYSAEDWQKLAEDLLKLARATSEFVAESSPWGVKYIVTGPLGCADRFEQALTVWFVEGNAPPRLVTAYPA
jgi:hypothetical protein